VSSVLYVEEQQLDQACKSGLQLYLAEINAVPRLTHAEERALAMRVQAGDVEAKRRFILANLRLVVAVARKFPTSDLDLLDHIQNGYFGLVRAVERFDPIGFNVHFGTYAMFWIRQAISRGQEDSARLIRLPAYIQDQIRAMDKKAEAWFQAHGTEATNEYLASCLGVDVAHVRMLQSKREWTLSLDYSDEDRDDDEYTLADRLVDPQSEESYLQVGVQDVHGDLSRQLRQALYTCLTPRERIVVSLYFGLGVEAMTSYADIGREIGVSRTRARTILVNALPKLQSALSGVYQEVDA
jgi:RNA polymerase primary sigma factor